MRKLDLINTPKVALIDESDYDLVYPYNWYLNKRDQKVTTVINDKTIYLHTLIFGKKEGYEIDHKDRNGLNNQRENLRYATSSQQKMNKGLGMNNTSGYKGVSYDVRRNLYRAYIGTKFLGRFHNKIDAALAYNTAASVQYGEFAVLNQIGEEKMNKGVNS